MASIFISHSGIDDALASELEAWLRSSGFTDLFLDRTQILGGAKWRDALKGAAGACRVVVCLVTENWLASDQCLGEFQAAWYMGKRLLPLFLLSGALGDKEADALRRVKAEDQGLDLAPIAGGGRLEFSRDEMLAERLRRSLRAAGALAAIGLDPEAFEIDRALRPAPFPGLASFADDDADAALFFGRSREIAETLEELRAMRAVSDRRVLMILGASGAGKSSLLKAGIIPRLRRESPAWIPLRAFRPGADPLLNFAEAIGRTLMDFGVREPDWIAKGSLRRTLLEAWQAGQAADVLSAAAERLRTAANRPGATILIGVDQAEELARAEGESGEALSAYLRAAMDAGDVWRLAFTIRTDSFPELQAHPRFQGLEARGYDLRALPTFKFDDVVSQPAKRYGVEIDHGLVENLVEDAPGRDALPLLAFAMQRLWDQFAAQKRIGLSDYRSMGGLSGLIEDAAERALAGQAPEQANAPRPSMRKAQDELGARTFLPPLADVNDEGAAIRRVAAWSEFDEESRALLDRFADWRLLVKKSDTGTVEVAHEALFREWPRLAGWLEPERARLEALRGLSVAATAWDRNRRKKSFTTHAGQRLQALKRLQKSTRYREQIDKTAAAYIKACRKAARGRTWGVLGAVLSVPVLGFAALVVVSIGIAVRAEWLQQRSIARYTPHVVAAEKLAAAAPGSEFQDCAVNSPDCPVMVVIPDGRFRMGSLETDPEADGDEFPQRDIDVRRFAVSKFEITWDEWEACLRSGGCNNHEPGTNNMGKGRKPVIGVSWDDAQNYAKWLSRMTGSDYRLLSEAEWEYAARGAVTTEARAMKFAWGDEAPICEPGALNGAAFSKCQPPGTRDVGAFAANAFGLYDMNGNVWEWVEDCYATYNPAQSDAKPVENRDATSSCTYRVLRGGSWGSGPQVLRSAIRNWYAPASRGNDLGFRLARTL